MRKSGSVTGLPPGRPTTPPPVADPSRPPAGIQRPRGIQYSARVGAGVFGYIAVATLLSVLAWFGGENGVAHAVHDPWPTELLAAWYRGDSGWYVRIASEGYSYTPGEQSPIAFFPTYPLVVRAVTGLTGDPRLAGQLVTWACGLAALLLFAVWVRRFLPRRAAGTAIALLACYPYSLYLFGTGYADASFLLTAVAALLLVERRQYWAAGVVGALATAGRPVGVAVAVALVVRMLEIEAAQRQAADGTPAGRVALADLWRQVPRIGARQLGVLLSGVGLAGWCAYLWVRFGDPLAFATVQAAPGWNQGSGPRTWFKVDFAYNVYHLVMPTVLATGAQAVCVLVVLALLPVVWRRLGWGYLAYTLVVVAIPLLGTKDFMGCGRYMLVAFPAFAAAGLVLDDAARGRRWLRPLVLAVSVAWLFTTTYFYGWGYEVS